jgi:hypothetical protein
MTLFESRTHTKQSSCLFTTASRKAATLALRHTKNNQTIASTSRKVGKLIAVQFGMSLQKAQNVSAGKNSLKPPVSDNR